MESSPVVTIVIPLYNKAQYIKRALDSVLSQTIQDFEIIIVGGKSTDGSEDIVNNYTDPRVFLIKEEGEGVSAARNQGVNIAKSELIAFLDADDEWMPEFLETILRLKSLYPNAGLYGTNRIVLHSEPIRREYPITCYDIGENWEGIIPSYFRTSSLGAHPFCTSSIAIPKKVFNKVNGFRTDLKYYEDLDIFARIAIFYNIAYSSRHLVYYSKDDENAATRNISLIPQVHPIITSINSLITMDKVDLNINTIPDLELYIDSLNISQAVNRLPLDKKSGRKYLMAITHKELYPRKRRLLISSFIPNKLQQSLSIIYKHMKKYFTN